jgi:hypothetical protein
MAHRIEQPKSVRAATLNALRFGLHENFFETLYLFLFIGRRALLFFSQEIFFTEIENKIDFFLVRFATDF